ncbi:hypothetical protein LCGC14_3034680, partial [marine sediment metagenome]
SIPSDAVKKLFDRLKGKPKDQYAFRIGTKQLILKEHVIVDAIPFGILLWFVIQALDDLREKRKKRRKGTLTKKDMPNE